MYVVHIAFAIVFVWLVALSAVLFWFYRFSKNLIGDVDKTDVVRLLKKIIETQRKNKNSISALEKEVIRIDTENLRNVQKFSLVRFNPFNELGGDHSFVLTMIDGMNNGFILTGLHTRDRTRVYVKEIKAAKSRYKLSKEEQKALDDAISD